MIETDKLNLFLEEANSVIKNSVGTYQRLKPLCTYTVSDGDKSVTFEIELRGYVKDDEVFFLVAKVGDDKFFSRGYFTTRGGHCTSFAMTHDEPRGVNIQQGVLIEMRSLVVRMIDNEEMSDFASAILEELDHMNVKVQVVRYDGGDDSILDKGVEALDRLEIKSDKELAEQQSDAAKYNARKPEEPDDTIGEEFAKAVGDNEEKPDEDNPLDIALKGTQVYRIEKETFWQKVMKFFRKMLGLDKEREILNTLCSEMFNKKEDK